jgi:inorganic phosphate transporter, PiT family
MLVAIGVFTGYPLATAFTATGTIIGAGLALGGTPVWSKYVQMGTLWVLTPFVCGGLAYLLARLLRHENVPDEQAIPLLAGIAGLVLANIPFTFLAPATGGASMAAVLAGGLPLSSLIDTGIVTVMIAVVIAGLFWRDVKNDLSKGQNHLLFGIGALVAFSAGGSQVGLAVGPLVPMLDSFVLPLLVILVFGGIGMTLGQWMGSPRMIKAISQDFAALGPRRAVAALIPSFALAQVAVIYGLPVSFNAIIVSAVVGSGFAAGAARISRQKILYTVGGWVASLALSLVLAYGATTLVTGM